MTRRRANRAGRVSITTDWYTKLLNIWKKRHLQQCGAVLAGTAKENISSGDRNFLFIAATPLHTKIYHSKQTIVRSGMEVGFVIKKQDNSKDDFGPALTEILTEIIRHLPGNQRVRVTGFSVTQGPAIPPMAFRLTGEDDSRRLPFETIESEEFIFITARLPSHLITAPHVEIMQDALHVFIDERVAVIVLHAPVDLNCSHYTVHNGILDITLKKIRKA
jgi:hypothetical protein